jgi:hypothetical protein
MTCVRAFAGHGLGIAAHGDELAVLDGDGGGSGVFTVDGVQFAVEQDQVGGHGASLGGCIGGAAEGQADQSAPAAPSTVLVARNWRRLLSFGSWDMVFSIGRRQAGEG